MDNEVGRQVFEPETGEERIEALRRVASTKLPAMVDGVFVEHHWARMILELYDDLGAEAQHRLSETPVPRMPALIDAWAKGITPKGT